VPGFRYSASMPMRAMIERTCVHPIMNPSRLSWSRSIRMPINRCFKCNASGLTLQHQIGRADQRHVNFEHPECDRLVHVAIVCSLSSPSKPSTVADSPRSGLFKFPEPLVYGNVYNRAVVASTYPTNRAPCLVDRPILMWR
jgi:hypothetical protein